MWYAEDDSSRHDHPPDTMIVERCAITCRAAPSFIRVGHLELWSRRAARGVDGAAAELRSLVEHAIDREFANEVNRSMPFKEQLMAMVRVFAKRQVRVHMPDSPCARAALGTASRPPRHRLASPPPRLRLAGSRASAVHVSLLSRLSCQ